MKEPLPQVKPSSCKRANKMLPVLHILLFFLLLPYSLGAEDIEIIDLRKVMADDAIFSPNGVTSDSIQAREKLGLTFPGTQSSPASIPRVAVRSFSESNAGEGGIIESVKPRLKPIEASPPQGGLGNDSNLEGQPQQNNSSSQNQGEEDFSSSAISGLDSGGAAFGLHSGSGHVRGGLLYSDEPAPSQAKASNPAQIVTPGQIINPVALNRANHGGSSLGEDKRNTASAEQNPRATAGSGLMATSPLGQFESSGQSGAASKNSESSGGSVLDKIAKGLGRLDNFFGTNGASSARSQRGLASGQGQGSASVNIADQPLKDPKAILQAQFDKFNNQRGLASRLEFGSADSSLFKGMCEHYKTYARRHRIPNKQNPCTD